jgi:succinoglycan biosynthesis protein ExoM
VLTHLLSSRDGILVVTSPGPTKHSPTTDSLAHRKAVGGVPPASPARAVVVAVLTYRRPAELAVLLPELSRQASGRPSIQVLVVDNDPAASGEAVVAETNDPAVRYVHEPRPGIAAARNRALDEAASYDLLVFIDDDEWPNPTWLQSMLEVYDRTSSAAVVGPVISQYAAEPDPWIKAGRFFDRRRLPSGTQIDVAATNNLLLDLRQVRAFGLRFDEALGLSGGSDTLFTRELHRRGGTLVWCDEAIVIDQVPIERLTRRWVLLRALRIGNSWSRTSIMLSPSAVDRSLVRIRLTGRGALRTLTGAAQFGLGVATRNMARRARGLRMAARGIGMVSGAYGYAYSEYRRRPS